MLAFQCLRKKRGKEGAFATVPGKKEEDLPSERFSEQPPTLATLVQQLKAIRAVGLGRTPRKNANIADLEKLASELSDDRSLLPLVNIEWAIRTSIERLGSSSEIARLAALEFGTAMATRGKRYLKHRRLKAQDELGIGEDALELAEERMLHALASDLLRRVEAKRRSQGTAPDFAETLPPTLPPVARGIEPALAESYGRLAEVTGRLHFALLAAIFVSRADDGLSREQVAIDRSEMTCDPEAIHAELFQLVGHLKSARSQFEDVYWRCESGRLTDSQLRTLWFMFNTIDEHMPFTAQQRVIIRAYVEALRDTGAPGELVGQAKQIQSAVWEPWLAASLPRYSDLTTSAAEIVAAKAIAILQHLMATVGITPLSDGSVQGEQYLSLVEQCYDLELRLDSRLVRERAREYFETMPLELARSTLIWLQSKDSKRGQIEWEKITFPIPPSVSGP